MDDKSSGPQKAKQGKSQYRAQGPRGKPNYRQQATISASGIHNDDIGIFVTSDKGLEKKCLQELADLLGEFFDEDSDSHDVATADDNAPTSTEKEVDIEANISAELDSLRPQAAGMGTDDATQKLALVTLDIPCVSFVRFPAKSTVDPVEVVRKLCLTASDKNYSGPRSRYIKRLTPVSLLRKTLNDGLETLCSKILPKHFLVDTDPTDETKPHDHDRPPQKPCMFAIRPTSRNNNKINRDEIIRIVADRVTSLGNHTVDLKAYDKLILVDVYRNVIGMSVVGSEFETFRRFNLAEIHASHLDDDDEKQKTRG